MMYRYSEKPLLVLLILVLGFSPIQSAMSALAASPDGEASGHLLMHGHQSMGHDVDDSSFSDYPCANSHCASFVLDNFAGLFISKLLGAPEFHPQINFKSHSPHNLFRPPRG